MSLLKILKNNFFYNQKNIYLYIFVISAVSRIFIAYFYGDRGLENEWGILAKNLYNFNSFSIIKFNDLFVPNLWMPPIYGYFVYVHALIFGLNENLAAYVICTQIIISSITPIIFYKIISKFFSQNLSLIGGFIFSLFPLIVYSSSQISSVSLYQFLFLAFIYLFLNLTNLKSYKNFIIIGFLAGILILTRRDFVLIYIFSLFYLFLFLKINLKKIIYIVLVTVITISPYLIRNYIAFDKIIIQAGLGYNVWKAYNPNAKVEGYITESKDLEVQLNKVERDINYRINEDKIYLDQGKNYIAANPKKYLKLFFKRVFSFYFYDNNSSQKNYYNNFHIIPIIFISIFSLAGIIICNKKSIKYNYLILIMLILLFIYSSFALLPRYKIYILPFQILLSLSFLEFLLNKFIKKN